MNPPTHADLDTFRSLLGQQVGLRFEDDKAPILFDLLVSRVRKTGSVTPAAYFEVMSCAAEVRELARALTVSETYFFRNPDQFSALEALLSARAQAPSRHLRILSAGCSSGEEIYSIAISIQRTLRDLHNWTLSLLGVDLNPDAVDKARSALYSRWSLRGTPDAIRDQYFAADGSQHRVTPTIRNMVRFEIDNLVQPTSRLWSAEAFDIVFCRNVLMYFSPDAACRVVRAIATSLSPGGYLFLGHAENLRGFPHDFHLKHTHGTFYYARRDALEPARPASVRPTLTAPSKTPAPAPLSEDTSWFEAIAQASARIEKISQTSSAIRSQTTAESKDGRDEQSAGGDSSAGAARRDSFAPAMDLMKQEKFQEALRLLADEPEASEARPDLLLLRAMLLVSTGDLAGAEALCKRVLGLDELNAGVHYVVAICREHLGDRDGAIEHSQTAAYLDADFAMPHLQLGRMARRRADFALARRELSLAAGLLRREDAARIVLFGGGFSRETLIELCRRELKLCGASE